MSWTTRRSGAPLCNARISECTHYVRRDRGAALTQAELAERLGISQSDVSKLERRRDVRLSTLRDDTAALGARLRLVAETRDGAVDLDQPGGTPR